MIKHLAIIMDGNGRWAAERGMPRVAGHKVGAEKVKEVIQAAKEMGIQVLSLYAFSTENFKRGTEETMNIFGLIAGALETLMPKAMEEDIHFRFVGELELLPEPLLGLVVNANKQTLNNHGLTVVVMLAYGGLSEVAKAATHIMRQRLMINSSDEITVEELRQSLMTANLPDPDVVVRYGGEMRLSNFMPLQSVYSELIFFKKYWPEFEKEDIRVIAEKYEQIKRKFGRVL